MGLHFFYLSDARSHLMLHVHDGEFVLMLSSLYIRHVMHDCGKLGGLVGSDL